ncbi:MAG: asparagine synthase C-terminal domain-containing protein [Nitrososphaerota archaeon]|jgi:asparagine synthase (glutamine-hydrolysing)|nr:asparagine synthase C-terminal domain-containing protein [Nitrososphaerota archaeon]
MSFNESEVNKLLPEIKTLVNKVVKKNLADGFLFSAGTDTQIIAYEAIKYKPDIPCITLAFKHGQPKDAEYVKKMVELLHLNQETYQFGKEDVYKFYPQAVEALKKYDPMEIRNSLPLYIGLTILKSQGIKTVYTGDALDELFGYPWQFHLTEEQFIIKQQEMWAEMGFASFPMAASLGMEIKAPYRDPEFMDWAMKLPIKYKINFTNGIKYSKWILRKAYEDVLPQDIIWRPKAPLEQGTGTEALRTYFNDLIEDTEFNERKAAIKAEDDVEIQDQEQLLYYEVFRKKFGKPKNVFPKVEGAVECPKCHGHIKTKIQFCKICGAYPI